MEVTARRCKLAADRRRRFVRPTWPNKMCNRFAKENRRTMEMNEVTYAVRGAVFEVNRVLGSGFLEKVYEKALFSLSITSMSQYI